MHMNSLLFICRMHVDSTFNLEIRIIATNCHAWWFSLNKVVDANVTNFRDLIDEVVDKYRCDFSDIVRVFYFCTIEK